MTKADMFVTSLMALLSASALIDGYTIEAAIIAGGAAICAVGKKRGK